MTVIKSRKLTQSGHIERISQEIMSLKVLNGSMVGSIKSRRRRKRWVQCVIEDL